jgi:hypothetical protein
MAKYRKKPIVIDAIQLTSKTFHEVLNFIGDDSWSDADNDEVHISIVTLEGTMEAYNGDYIIKGIKGEFYPCKEDIFNASYEKVG